MTSTRPSDVALELPERVDPILDELTAAGYGTYAALCRKSAIATAENALTDIAEMDVVRRSGVDKQGRVVFTFFPGHLKEGCDLERVTMYALQLMHQCVVCERKEYTAVWVCNNLLDSRLSFWWFRRTYKMLPHAYHKQMRCLCVVHPTIQVRVLLWLISYVVKHDIWNKLIFADRIEFLDEVLLDETIKGLPEAVIEYDKYLDKEMYAALDDPALSQMTGGSWATSKLPAFPEDDPAYQDLARHPSHRAGTSSS